MDRIIEEKFVRTFIEKRIQDRIIFELSDSKRRDTAIDRFCHRTDDLVKPKYILHKSNKLWSDEILNMISELSNEKSCYVISFLPDIDGIQTTLEGALSRCLGAGMPSIMIVGENIAVIETEQVQGPATKYILYKE